MGETRHLRFKPTTYSLASDETPSDAARYSASNTEETPSDAARYSPPLTEPSTVAALRQSSWSDVARYSSPATDTSGPTAVRQSSWVRAGGEAELLPEPTIFAEFHYESCDDESCSVASPRGRGLSARDSLALEEIRSVASLHSEIIDADEYELPITKPDPHASRRRRLWMGILLAVLALIGLATGYTTANRRADRAADAEVSKAEEARPEPTPPPTVAPTMSAPTAVPSAAPSSSLVRTLEFQLLKTYVRNPEDLLDPSTPQGKAFEQIIAEGHIEDLGFRTKQRFAMMTMYFSMGGEDWAWQGGWSTFDEEECDWHGVAICRYRDGRRIAAGIQLPSNGAFGVIPPEICMLEDLETILLENNQLVGEIPACLTTLDGLFEFDVHNNKLTGEPPAGFLELPRLTTLDLSSNKLTGDLSFLEASEEALSASTITTLKLDNNNFSGGPPLALLESLVNLEEVTLQGTGVTGDVTPLCSGTAPAIVSVDCGRVACNGACCECLL